MSEFDAVTQICLTATKGLSYFRSGLSDLGRKFYIEAIERTNHIKNQQLNWLAILNYVREEIIIGSEFVIPLMDIVAKIPNESKGFEINILKQDVLDLLEK